MTVTVVLTVQSKPQVQVTLVPQESLISDSSVSPTNGSTLEAAMQELGLDVR